MTAPLAPRPGDDPAAMTGLAELVGVPFDSLTRLIADLTARGLTVAAAESLTGGLLTAILTEIPGSSAVVRGGLVVYATDLKHTLADVDSALLAERGPVDPDVAAALAHGARIRCNADIGIGLTGVAGPDPQHGMPVGTWFCAVDGPGGHTDQHSSQQAPSTAEAPPGTESSAAAAVRVRSAVRAAAVRAALEMVANIAAMDS